MEMVFDEKLAALQVAKTQAEVGFKTAVTPARDAYALAGTAHVEAETAWMNSPADQALQDAAAATWSALVTARTELLDAVSRAAIARQAALDAAWQKAVA